MKKIAKEIRSLLQREADTVLVRLKRDREVYDRVGKHLKELFDKRQPALAEDDDEDSDAEEQRTNILMKTSKSGMALEIGLEHWR